VFRPKVTLPSTGVTFMKIMYLVALNNHKKIAGFKKAAELLTVRKVNLS